MGQESQEHKTPVYSKLTDILEEYLQQLPEDAKPLAVSLLEKLQQKERDFLCKAKVILLVDVSDDAEQYIEATFNGADAYATVDVSLLTPAMSVEVPLDVELTVRAKTAEEAISKATEILLEKANYDVSVVIGGVADLVSPFLDNVNVCDVNVIETS